MANPGYTATPTPPGARDYTLHPYRLSDSAWNTLLTCERRFQLDRLLENAEMRREAPTADMIRGTAYGVGVQSYLVDGDMDRAAMAVWLAYSPEIEDPPKSFMAKTINNLLCSKERLDWIRQRYTVATFHGRPAVELSFRLNLDARWYFVGYVDVVLQSKETGIYGPLEVKTTGSQYKDVSPMYQYSGQNLGYSIILDQIAGAEQSSFETPYLVCRDKLKEFVPELIWLPFRRSLLDRFKWFMSLGMDLARLNGMLEVDVFPQRQKGCLAYGKVCPHFGFCGMTATDRLRQVPTDKNEYQFVYNLEDVIKDHIRRIG